LRVTSLEEATRVLDSGSRAIVPGDVGASELVHRIRSADPEERMPYEEPPLAATEIELLERWIDEGAVWRPHWSLLPPVRPDPPAVHDASFVRNPIDDFVLEHLEELGVEPAPEASREELLRRLSLDLTGLPPTLEEARAFLDDASPASYERLVDRLLASPAFAEHWARHWMDLARYGDSDGYEQDRWRPDAWRWREWLVAAIDRDQPYDEFTLDQIAGDLLPGGDGEALVATGFHRNSLLNREPGVDLEEDHVKATIDRVNTVGTAWLGLTIGCAECHDHKYDPIRQREYYGLYAFFDSLDDRLARAPLASELEGVSRAREEYEAERERYVAATSSDARFVAWRERVAALPSIWVLADSYALPTLSATQGANLYPQEDGSFLASGQIQEGALADCYTALLDISLESITAVRLELLADEMLPGGGPGWGARGTASLSGVKISSAPRAEPGALVRVPIARACADRSAPEHPIEHAIDADGFTAWSFDRPGIEHLGCESAAVFVLGADAGHAGGTRASVALHQYGGEGKCKIGRFRLSFTSADPEIAARSAVPESIVTLARKDDAALAPEERAHLARYWRLTELPDEPAFREFDGALARWDRARGEVWAQTVRERETPRTTRVHRRGDFLDPVGEPVEPATPAILPPLRPDHEPATRLDLARWLVDPANPLTARVEANRIWMHLFGEGLVRTPADFGTQGEAPADPALLDWLASELVRLGWSRKALVRTIVTSATYRQSSERAPDLGRRELGASLFRQPRLRLTAEAVRDCALAAGGLLDRTVGGPSVAIDSHRRSLYVQHKRKEVPAMLAVFDAPDGANPCTRRERSTTPMQALVLMNDELFLDCARGLARRANDETCRILSAPVREPEAPAVDEARNYDFQLAAPVRGRIVRIALSPETHSPRQDALCLAEVEVEAAGENVARSGVARQSSTAQGGFPARAIDGNRDGGYARGSVTHTFFGKEAWWEVELATDAPIERIRIFNRVPHFERLDYFRLSILDAERNEVWKHDVRPETPPVVEPADARDRLAHAFRIALARSPETAELDELERLLGTARELYENDATAAEALAGPRLPLGVGTREAAAWVLVARTILNLEEFTVRP
jgi:hypothetical protein